jgi:hypothetical protein
MPQLQMKCPGNESKNYGMYGFMIKKFCRYIKFTLMYKNIQLFFLLTDICWDFRTCTMRVSLGQGRIKGTGRYIKSQSALSQNVVRPVRNSTVRSRGDLWRKTRNLNKLKVRVEAKGYGSLNVHKICIWW